jgi:hypothetical protein
MAICKCGPASNFAVIVVSFLSTRNFHLNPWAGQTHWAILFEKVNFRTEITEDNFDGMIGHSRISNSGRSPLTCPELYQSAYGIVLALRFAVAQTGHESTLAL